MIEERSYDDRDGWIWFDGKLVPWREANIHVLTHALHYASSVFEGQRAYGGEIFKLGEHRDRKSVESGKSVSVSVDLGGRRSIKQKKTRPRTNNKSQIKKKQ